jgi:nucleoside-diphosphate-sugar epimerase
MEKPIVFNSEDELEDFLSIPQKKTIEVIQRLAGDFMILGIGGKMGPTLGNMIVKAAKKAGVMKKVYGVSRFSNKDLIDKLEQLGISCITCDLLNPEDVEKLPKVKNIIFMAGRKFGVIGTDFLYWAINTIAPVHAARHFHDSNIVVFSTGNIYNLCTSDSTGSSETDSFNTIGEYANSCLGRERIFEYFSRENGTKVLLFRLNYAIDLRYGVLLEIGKQVYEGMPINLEMGYANVIWQGDANNYAIQCLEQCASPPEILNVTGEKIRVKEVASQFGEIMRTKPVFTGEEAPTALLSDNSKMKKLFGEPPTSPEQMIHWTADWIMNNGKTLNKPTHFQTRDGEFLD